MPANWFTGVLLVFKPSSNEEHIKHPDWFIGKEPQTGAATSAQVYLLTEYEYKCFIPNLNIIYDRIPQSIFLYTNGFSYEAIPRF